MRILFSPVGGTDPVSEKNGYDGGMLHICRHYSIDKVYLYMSKEILEKQNKDQRYTAFLERLAKQQKREIQYELIERPELVEVHKFDQFYTDFEDIIGTLLSKMAPEDELFLNASSGTPGMKTAITVLHALGEHPYRLIQVSTPEKQMNEHSHSKDFDIDIFWDFNEELEREGKNRCEEISCPSLIRINQEESIKKHLRAYDYEAALRTAEAINEKYTEKYIKELRTAFHRSRLHEHTVNDLMKQVTIPILPVKKTEVRRLVEYALALDIKLRKEEYADFVRAWTPIIAEMFELILKKHCKINVDNYIYENDKGVRKWDEQKMEGSDEGKRMLDVLNEEYSGAFNPSFIKSNDLRFLIKHFSNSDKLKKLIEDLRNAEESIRNTVAHAIVSLDAERIKRQTGFTPQELMEKIKKLFEHAGPDYNIEDSVWNSYDDMNEEIINLI